MQNCLVTGAILFKSHPRLPSELTTVKVKIVFRMSLGDPKEL